MKTGIEKLYDRLPRLGGTSTEARITKFILSLWAPDRFPYSVANMLGNADDLVKKDVMQAIAEYARWGKTDAVLRIGQAVYDENFPKVDESKPKKSGQASPGI